MRQSRPRSFVFHANYFKSKSWFEERQENTVKFNRLCFAGKKPSLWTDYYKADELTTKPYRGYSKLMIYRFWIASIAWRGRKLLDLAEIWYTCSLGKCLGIFLHFLKHLIFRPCVPVFGPKMDRKPSGQYRKAKDCWIWLKFSALVYRANTPGDFF